MTMSDMVDVFLSDANDMAARVDPCGGWVVTEESTYPYRVVASRMLSPTPLDA